MAETTLYTVPLIESASNSSLYTSSVYGPSILENVLTNRNEDSFFINGTYTTTRTYATTGTTTTFDLEDYKALCNSKEYLKITGTAPLYDYGEYHTSYIPDYCGMLSPINYTATNIYAYNPPTKRELLRRNITIISRTRGEPVRENNAGERVALESLREVISEKEFRRYLKYGFIMVAGKNGSQYQVFRNGGHVKVWRGGVLVEEICVHIKSNFRTPPTDRAIAFKAMIEADEEEFKSMGNVYKLAKAA